MSKKVPIGMIVDDIRASKMLRDLMELSATSNSYEITHLIVQRPHVEKRNRLQRILHNINRLGFYKYVSSVSFSFLQRFEAFLVQRNSENKPFFETFDLSEYPVAILEVEPQVSPSGFVYRYKDNDIEKIESLNLNLLIRGGSGILRGDILTVCKNGVLSFHHADNNVNRGTPPAFWEVAKRQNSTGFIIQRLKDELDGGDVLFKGNIATLPMYMENLIKLYERANPFMHTVIEKLINEPLSLPQLPKQPYAHKLFTPPTLKDQFLYVWFSLKIKIKNRIRKLAGKPFIWGVAYQHIEDFKDVALWRSKKIENPPGRYLADPFVYQNKGVHYCFVEDFDIQTGKGDISVYEIQGGEHKALGKALVEDFHLSFPFLVEHNNQLYMCPESAQSKQIRLYKCIEFPLKWELEQVLMDDVSAADTCLFYENDKWWMLTNLCSTYKGDHASELHLFSSDDLLSDNWKKHPKNPLIFDSLHARNAGFIRDASGIYRVFQRQGFDIYGESLGVMKITSIDELDYAEELQFEISPNFYNGIKGTHTYNFANGLMAIDYLSAD